jgi:two-component sensor histidine kinase
MSRNVYHLKGNFKGILFILAIAIILGSLYYSQKLVSDLQEQSREFLRFRVKVIENSINNDEAGDLSFIFSNVIQTADFPIIYTDQEMNPQIWRNIDVAENNGREIPPDTIAYLKRLVAEFDKINPPIPISFGDTVLGYYHYGESETIRQLRWLPFIEIGIVALFILIGYAGFSSIKRSEERLIWVGMAKETAHQLGTPLSSQIGWLEYLKSAPEQLPKVIPELEKDLKRLKVITNRFSQIGSKPDLQRENLADIIQETVDYFKKRLPQKSAKVEINVEMPAEPIYIDLNSDLFSWVLENLIKNGLDALENHGGKIVVQAGLLNERQVFIDVSDTGKGIPKSDRKTIFKPGYSTKKRGWGLGLSLAKRIVEEYHSGKLLLKETHLGKGTTFRIIMNSAVNKSES